MKKITTIASVLSILLVNNAMAKGQHSLGVSGSVHNTQTELRTEYSELINTEKKSANDAGGGVFYKYTYTFKNKEKIYIEPEVFYDFVKYEKTDDAFTGMEEYYEGKETLTIKPNLGVKFNVGYHFNNKNDLAFGLGVQNVNYDIKWSDDDWNKSTSKSKIVPIFGLEYNYHINNKLALGLQYNFGYTEIDGPGSIYLDSGEVEQGVYKVNLNNAKMTLSYKF